MPRKDRIHNRIVRILLKLVKNDTNTYFDIKKNVPQFKVSAEFPKYTPDIHAFVKKGKDQVDVFQVWRGESVEVALFDLLRCSMVSNVRRLYVVTAPQEKPGYAWSRKEVYDLKSAMLKLLAAPYSRNLERILVPSCVVELTKKDLRSQDRMEEKIADWYNTGRVL